MTDLTFNFTNVDENSKLSEEELTDLILKIEEAKKKFEKLEEKEKETQK